MPRSLWFLFLLLIGSAAVLFVLQTRDSGPDLTLGGPLFDVTADEMSVLVITRSDGQFRLTRNEAGAWRLTGATSDYLDQVSMHRLLDLLAGSQGGPLLPGTRIEDPRYEFNTDKAVRLTVLASDGTRHSLALGVDNPVTGQYYASGAGRPTCFTVLPELKVLLDQLPVLVQAKTLLPGVDRDLVTRIDLQIADATFLFQRYENRWWVREPAAGVGLFGHMAQTYHARYKDRQLIRDGETWLLASERRVIGLIYETSEIVVRQILPTASGQEVRQSWELDPPRWQIRLTGAGLCPGDLEPHSLEVGLSPPLDQTQVPGLRRGNVLITDTEALHVLQQAPQILLDAGALSFQVADADSLHLDGPYGAVVWARPTDDGWLGYPPPGQTFKRQHKRMGKEAASLVVDLDRMPILAVLSPSNTPTVLAADERLRLTLWYGDQAEVMEFGYLDVDQLSVDQKLAIVNEDNLPPVAAWHPASGRLLQVPGHLLISGRTLSDNYVPR